MVFVDAGGEQVALPGDGGEVKPFEHRDDLEDAVGAGALVAGDEAVMAEQEPHEDVNGDRLDLLAEAFHREAMDAGEEAAVAEFGFRAAEIRGQSGRGRSGRRYGSLSLWERVRERANGQQDTALTPPLSQGERENSPVARPSGLSAAVFNVWTLFSWEMRQFAWRPSSWGLGLAMTLVAGWSFAWLIALLSRGGPALRGADAPIGQFLGPNLFLVGACTLLVPLVTMNLIADERRRGTWEWLTTAPVSRGEIVFAKFAAGWCQLTAFLSPWVFFVIVLRVWNGGTEMVWKFVPWPAAAGVAWEAGPVLAAILGWGVIGLTFTALGVLCSSFARGPIAAGCLAFGVMLNLLLLAVLPKAMAMWQAPEGLVVVAESLSCWGHLEQFRQGLISPSVIAGHMMATVILLGIATRVVERGEA